MSPFEEAPALTPENGGGLCISTEALQAADIIVSTTTQLTSSSIRLLTWSVVSHSALCAGGGIVIEAIKGGVTKTPIGVALSDDVLAVVYRHPAMSPDVAASIIKFADAQVGKPYSIAGALVSREFFLCRTSGYFSSGFFCSQLVLEAYRRAGLPLTSTPPSCSTPGDVVTIATYALRYVGHLKGNPSLLPSIVPIFKP